jgi:hypothetical protein
MIQDKEEKKRKYKEFLEMCDIVHEQYCFVKRAREELDQWIEEQKEE